MQPFVYMGGGYSMLLGLGLPWQAVFECWSANLSSYSNQGYCHMLCQDMRVETDGVVGGMLIP